MYVHHMSLYLDWELQLLKLCCMSAAAAPFVMMAVSSAVEALCIVLGCPLGWNVIHMPVQHSHRAEQPDVCHWYLLSCDAPLPQERKGTLVGIVDL